MYKVTEHETDVFGLKYRPSIANDDADMLLYKRSPPREFTELDASVLRDILRDDQPKVILEIGVHRASANYEFTSTRILAGEKSKESIYIGIDLVGKEFVQKWGDNIHTIKGDSGKHKLVYDLMEELQLETIDLIFIDGKHSVNQVFKDWQYAERLSKNGIVVMHDTNGHPGPYVIFDAIDEQLFVKQKWFVDENDWGMGTLRKL